jgi:hypothetical protein
MSGKRHKPPVDSDELSDPSAGQPFSQPSSSAEDERSRETLIRSAAESDKISPPPPGIERQYFHGALGVPTRNRKREWELAVESLERLGTERDYATARLTIIWLWNWAQVTHALTQDVHADLVAELPGLERTLSQYERERAMLVAARGLDEQWRNDKLAALDDLIEKHRRALDAIRHATKHAGPGRPRRPEVFDDLIAAFALLVAVQHGAERPASYREVAEAFFFWDPESRVEARQVRDIKRNVTNRIRSEVGRARYPIFAMLSRAWASDLRRVRIDRSSRS